MALVLHGGKTTPRLLQDFVDFDPRRAALSSYNILTRVPFHDATKEDEDHMPPIGGCRHEWAAKEHQSIVPKPSEEQGLLKSTPVSNWTLGCYCIKCRSHAQIKFSFGEELSQFKPCPTLERPLHHFLYCSKKAGLEPREDGLAQPVQPTPWNLSYSFRCSSPTCAATLNIDYRPPRLNNHLGSLLTDRLLIKSRAERQIALDPQKFEGHAPPSPGTVLETTWRVINMALSEAAKRPYPRDSKNYLLNFGDSCDELMELLGLRLNGNVWDWPEIPSTDSELFTDDRRILLDDVREEIHVLMAVRPDDERRSVKFNFTPDLAMVRLRDLLGAARFKRSPSSDTMDLTYDEHPYYASLGSTAAFHDDLLFFSYQQQIAVDRLNEAYYFECLQAIAEGRKSEDLITKATIEESQGRISLRDIRDAYQHLGLAMEDPRLADDTIIGTFRARLSDAPKQESILRRDLKIIGQHRNSRKIEVMAAHGVNNYEQALSFLDAEAETSDEFITSMYTLKVDGNPSDEPTARQAVALIANHRESMALKQWLETGTLGATEMDLDQAYRRLGVTERLADDDMVLTLFNLHTEEQPSQADELKRALTVIAKKRDSKLLLSYVGLGSSENDVPLDEWPVALNNIGNTCYLNSLLQYYFSIRPFRELVLHVDEFKTDVSDEAVHSKRVGSRIVSKREVQRAQQTADELKKLFRGLIGSPARSYRPDTEVARLTLVTPKAEIIRRQSIRQSMSNAERPKLDEVMTTLGEPTQEAALPTVTDDAMLVDSPAAAGPATIAILSADGHNSSSETLVDAAVANDDAMKGADEVNPATQKGIFENKENLAPEKVDEVQEIHADAKSAPLAETSPSRLNEQPRPAIELEGSEVKPSSAEKELRPEAKHHNPPNRPPPVPPRPKAISKEDEALKEAEFAAEQQDVSEIKDNILFQLECAIRPEGVDSSGEQIDQIKRLFYGKQKTYITNKVGKVRSKEEWMSDIKVNVLKGPSDIYTALDGAFDVEDVNVDGGTEPKYNTISQLPPVLQIHVQRAQYDPKTKKPFKSENHLQFHENLYLDRYVDSEDTSLLQKRQQSWEWKQKLSKAEARMEQLVASDLNMNMSDILRCAKEYLVQLKSIEGEHAIDVPPMLFDALEQASKEARSEFEALDSNVKNLRTAIASQFADLQQIAYRLAAVFIHRGSSSAGHYWVYIYDFKNKIWRNYNDEHVTRVVDVAEIFEAPTGPRPPTPYFLVYVKDEWKENLVDPVCRDVSEAEAAEAQAQQAACRPLAYEPINIDQDQMVNSYPIWSGPVTDSGPSGTKDWNDSQLTNTRW